MIHNPGGAMVKNLPASAGDIRNWVWSLGWENPLEQEMETHSSILAWEPHRQRSLVGHSPWSCKELDTTERLSTHTSRPGILAYWPTVSFLHHKKKKKKKTKPQHPNVDCLLEMSSQIQKKIEPHYSFVSYDGLSSWMNRYFKVSEGFFKVHCC